MRSRARECMMYRVELRLSKKELGGMEKNRKNQNKENMKHK